jgi:hypothetical protein
MFQFNSRELDLLEVLPASSPALKQNLAQIIDDSSKCNAAIASLDKNTGTYRIVLEGSLRKDMEKHGAMN